MLSDADRHKAADTLMTAEKTRKQATQLSVTFPGITLRMLTPSLPRSRSARWRPALN
jgi:hypothetical protein